MNRTHSRPHKRSTFKSKDAFLAVRSAGIALWIAEDRAQDDEGAVVELASEARLMLPAARAFLADADADRVAAVDVQRLLEARAMVKAIMKSGHEVDGYGHPVDVASMSLDLAVSALGLDPHGEPTLTYEQIGDERYEVRRLS